MSNIDKCPVCGKRDIAKQYCHDPESVFYDCPVCGRFEFSMENDTFSEFDKNELASFLFYEGFRNGKGKIEFRYHSTKSRESCDTYVEEFKKGNNIAGLPVHMDKDIVTLWFPKSFSQRIDMILLKLNEMTEYVGQPIKLDVPSFLSCMFVKRYDQNGQIIEEDQELTKQAFYMTSYLLEAEYIKGSNCISGEVNSASSYFGTITITPKGYDRIDQLQKNSNNGKGTDVLVAMKFGDDTIKLRESIRQGIFEAGYNNYVGGIEIRPDSGGSVINYPEQHIKMGILKNKSTNYSFKKCVRIIKNMREEMKDHGYSISPKISSFGLESLLWNVEESAYTRYSSILRYTFDEVIKFLKDDFENYHGYTEANGIKLLFSDTTTLNAYQKFIEDLNNFYEYDIKE